MTQALTWTHWIFLAFFIFYAATDGRSEEPVASVPISEEVLRLNSPRPEDRVEAGKLLIANPQQSIPALLVALATFDGPSLNDLKEDRLLYLVAITDVLRTMVVERFEAVRAIRLEIRNMDRRRVLAPLVAGAGSGYRSLRINATVILASVVDNGTVCLVLQQLRNGARNAPEKINLVQVVSSMAGYAFRETVEATAQMVQKVRAEQSGFSPEDWRRIAVHLDEVEQGMSASINKDHSLPPTEAFCKDFDYEG